MVEQGAGRGADGAEVAALARGGRGSVRGRVGYYLRDLNPRE